MAELDFRPGDYVKLRLALKEVEGFVLESSDAGIFLLKLKSGYNIGIPKENVLGGKVIRRFKDEKNVGDVRDNKNVGNVRGGKKDKDKKNIGLVITGGTIASKLDSGTGGRVREIK